MRLELARLAGVRLAYTATFGGWGRTILVARGQPRPRRGQAVLRDVLVDHAEGVPWLFVCQHVWVNETGEMIALGAKAGDRLRFTAVAAPYQKAELSRVHAAEEDYKLTGLQDVTLVTTPRG